MSSLSTQPRRLPENNRNGNMQRKFKIVKKKEEEPVNPEKLIEVVDSSLKESFRLIDFHVCDEDIASDNRSGSGDDSSVASAGSGSGKSDRAGGSKTNYNKGVERKDNKEFRIQMFGINEKGETCSIFVDDYHPFFYVKVSENWTNAIKASFIRDIRKKIGKYHESSILHENCEIVEKKKLYGFDGGKNHKFVMLVFKNTVVMNRVKNLWYEDTYTARDGKTRRLKPNGYEFANTNTEIYEANIPPVLRFFHIQKISPSGWIEFSLKKTRLIDAPSTSCNYEYRISYEDIVPLNDKETTVPYKICSFDIEASSSHGDFPIPVKTYKKLATNIVDAVIKLQYSQESVRDVSSATQEIPSSQSQSQEVTDEVLTHMIYTAFQYSYKGLPNYPNIEVVYPKRRPKEADMVRLCKIVMGKELRHLIKHEIIQHENTIERMFEMMKENTKEDEQNGGDGDDHDDRGVGGEHMNDIMENDSGLCETGGVGGGGGNRKMKKTTPKNRVGGGGAGGDGTPDLSIKVVDLLNSKLQTRETKITLISDTLGSIFPRVEGDKVTFIGSTFVKYGQDGNRPYLNHCIALDTCDSIEKEVPNSQLESYDTEAEVLLAWTRLIQRENPDIIIGYNIFGFDYQFMFRRSVETQCYTEFLKLSRNNDEFCGTSSGGGGGGFKETVITSDNVAIEQTKIALASGQYDLHFIKMTGRLQIDVFNYLRRDFNLSSYKLDDVSSYFIGDGVKSVEYIETTKTTRVYSNNLVGLCVGNFVKFEQTNHSTDLYKEGQKFKVVSVVSGSFEVEGYASPDMKMMVRWGLAKDDVSPQDIFRMTKEGPKERSIIAKYCIQDCNLVHHLMNKIDIITGYVEMAKICSVPISFLVMRGQGIKLTSYVAMKCREKDTLMPVIDKDTSESGYEGAIVLPPKCGLYLDNPVACNDYSSLYPSSMISENLSHDSKVWTKEYDLNGELMRETGESAYDNLPGYKYVDITYDMYKWTRPKSETKMAAAAVKVKCGTKVCRFAQFPNGEKGIMPSILEELLLARKTTRKLAEKQTDAFMANILDKRQLGYKVTANSLYGQCGAKTSTFYEVDVAASTTATGRKLLTYARRVVEEAYGDVMLTTSHATYPLVHSRAEYIYGDTDSVFFTFNLETPEGVPIRGKDAIEITIELAKQVGDYASRFLKGPHGWVYEKTICPFALLRKKGYVGVYYEQNPNKGKLKSMGIVLKRRDNAPIVKEIYGGIIDILMKEQNIDRAIQFLRDKLQFMIDQKCPIEKLIITKSLRSDYKNPAQIAHKVLADRMGVRDPGNKPNTGDRMPYAYIHNSAKGALQGDKIEHPEYIQKHKLQLDYSFYITNQIMKPVQQLFGLVLEQLPAFQKKYKGSRFTDMLETMTNNIEDPIKKEKKITDLRYKEVKALLFDEFLVKAENLNKGNKAITDWFKRK
jgi:DNA polymerase elongation subunit (family B)